MKQLPVICASLLVIAFLLPAAHVFSQNVGINNAGLPPDSSAILDINSKTKGFLIPRMTLLERTPGIQKPATGLLVYQTNGTAGFYYNAGTPVLPNWILLRENPSIGSGFAAYAGTWQTLNNNTATVVLMSAEEFDDGNTFNTGNSTFTVPSTGVYHFEAHVLLDGGNGASSGYTSLELFKNTVQLRVTTTQPSLEFHSISLSATARLTAGDVISLKIYQNSGFPMTTSGGPSNTYFSGYRIY